MTEFDTVAGDVAEMQAANEETKPKAVPVLHPSLRALPDYPDPAADQQANAADNSLSLAVN